MSAGVELPTVVRELVEREIASLKGAVRIAEMRATALDGCTWADELDAQRKSKERKERMDADNARIAALAESLQPLAPGVAITPEMVQVVALDMHAMHSEITLEETGSPLPVYDDMYHGYRIRMHRRARRVLTAALSVDGRDGWPDGLESEKVYQARSDMNPDSRLSLIVQADGDVCLSVLDDRGIHGVEFCAPSTGGGKHPHTWNALRYLADAIRKDETPEVSHG